MRSSIPLLHWLNTNKYWDEEQRRCMLCIAARMDICKDGFTILKRYDASISPPVEFSAGKQAFLASRPSTTNKPPYKAVLDLDTRKATIEAAN